MKIINKKIIIILLFIVSLCINFFLIHAEIKNYGRQKKLQIDPANTRYYSDLNRAIPEKSKNIIRIVLFGDSRIFRWNPQPDIPGCEIINRGIPGETSSQALLRLDNDVISLKPDIVVIQTGVNDFSSLGILSDWEDFIRHSCKDNIKKMIQRLRIYGIKPVLLTVFPAGRVYPPRLLVWSDRTRDAIREINTFILANFSMDICIINCDTIFLDGEKMKKDFSSDLLHINSQGYTALNVYIKPYIQAIIKDIN